MRHRFNIGIPINDTVKLYMPLWAYGKENGSLMLDHSNSHYDGIINGALPSRLGWNFDGDDFINIGNNLGFENTSPFSIIIWVKRNVIGIWQTLIGKGASTSAWRLMFNSSNKLQVYLIGTLSIGKFGATAITALDRFFCLGVTYSGSDSPSGFTMYWNGRGDAGTPSGINTGGSILTSVDAAIGNAIGATSFLNGQLGEILVCSRVLSAQEMQNYYEVTRKKYGV